MTGSLLVSVIILAILPHLPTGVPAPMDANPLPPAPTFDAAIKSVEDAMAAVAARKADVTAANAALRAAHAALDAATAAMVAANARLSAGLKVLGKPVFRPGPDASSVIVYTYNETKGFYRSLPLPPTTPFPAA